MTIFKLIGLCLLPLLAIFIYNPTNEITLNARTTSLQIDGGLGIDLDIRQSYDNSAVTHRFGIIKDRDYTQSPLGLLLWVRFEDDVDSFELTRFEIIGAASVNDPTKLRVEVHTPWPNAGEERVPDPKTWIIIPSMLSAKQGPVMIEIEGTVCGKDVCTPFDALMGAEIYKDVDFGSDTWRMISSA